MMPNFVRLYLVYLSFVDNLVLFMVSCPKNSMHQKLFVQKSLSEDLCIFLTQILALPKIFLIYFLNFLLVPVIMFNFFSTT